MAAARASGVRRIPLAGRRHRRRSGITAQPGSAPVVPRPAVAAAPPWAFALPSDDGHLDNGLRVAAYDVPGQYVISVSVVVPMVLSDEPRDVEGVASLMSQLLDEGTQRHDSEEFAALLERHGIALYAGVNDGALMVDVDVPVRHLETALTLLADALSIPAFPEDEVRRLRSARLAGPVWPLPMAAHQL